jgi:superfamily II DNA or RNA helicase
MSLKKEAKIKLLNEVNAVVIGLSPREYKVISEMFKLKAADYIFNPKYKAMKWDGYIYFFNKRGKTYINFLYQVIPVIKDLGYSISIIDNRDQVKINVPTIDAMYLSEFGWELGEHQVNAINALIKNNGGIIKGGTGAGKTVCCWVLHDLYYTHCGFETLIIVPTKDLIFQTVEEFREFSSDVGYWGDSKKKINHPVVVSTWQTLMKQPDFVGKYKHIIMDECHSSRDFSKKVSKILNEYGANCYVRMGMTGTLPPHPCDYRTLECGLGKLVYEIPAKELIDQGWLSTMSLNLVCMDEDLRPEYKKFLETEECKRFLKENKLKSLSFTDYLKMLYPEFGIERNYLAKNEKRNKFIAEFVTAKTKQSSNSVVLVNTKSQGRALEELIPNSKFIHGDDNTKIRKKMFTLFSERDDVIMITTYGLAAVGLNIKRIFNIFMVDAGTSFVRVIQTLGRGLRKDTDKDHVNVYDIYSNLYFSKRHAMNRVTFYSDEGHDVDNKFNVKYKEMK